MKKCIVLFSGGIDSTTALYWALNQFGRVYALTFDYGQRHRIEVLMAKKITRKLNVPHKILFFDLKQIGGSSLTDDKIALPEFKRIDDIEGTPPSTYVPFRNGIFLALAASWGEANDIRKIVTGFNIIDSPDYPDTKKEFVEVMENAINVGTASSFGANKFKILAPFVNMKKSEIIKMGLSLRADYSYSISCYAGKEIPCKKCSSCLLRQKAWEELGLKDHLILRLEKEGKI